MLATANQVSNWLSVGYADAVICFVAKPEMESLLIVVNGNNFNDRPLGNLVITSMGDAWWQQTYQVNSIVLGYVRMLRNTSTMEIYLVSLLPPSTSKSPISLKS